VLLHLLPRLPRLRKAAALVLALLAAGFAFWPTPTPAASGVVDSVEAVVGRALTGAARAGEPITDVRLTAADPDATSVAVRLADPGVAELLGPGSRVDVVGEGAEVLADGATVLSVREAKPDRLVVLGLSRKNATRIAAASLEKPLAVTLR
jgi:pilus assembly protein CpaB